MRRVYLPAALNFLGWVQRGCAPLARGVAYAPSPSPLSSFGVQRALLFSQARKVVWFALLWVGRSYMLHCSVFFAHWVWAGFALHCFDLVWLCVDCLLCFALLRLGLLRPGLLKLSASWTECEITAACIGLDILLGDLGLQAWKPRGQSVLARWLAGSVE